MLAFAKDITKTDPTHPEEENNSELKTYMEYHRKLDSEKLIYHALDHAKTYLQKNISDSAEDQDKLQDYLKTAFPISSAHIGDAETMLLMLRKLVNGHNSTNNWYRMNQFYSAVVYDCLQRFVQVYNRLAEEKPDKAKEYNICEGEKVDFDDWVQLYFHDLDFLIGKPFNYLHYTFSKRNKAIFEDIEGAIQSRKSRNEAIEEIKSEFEIDPSAVKIMLGQKVGPKDMELFYTSAENPIYEYLYDTESEDSFMDGESLIDHSYFLGHQLQGLSEEDIEKTLQESSKLQNN
jgi:hypothetical protein